MVEHGPDVADVPLGGVQAPGHGGRADLLERGRGRPLVGQDRQAGREGDGPGQAVPQLDDVLAHLDVADLPLGQPLRLPGQEHVPGVLERVAGERPGTGPGLAGGAGLQAVLVLVVRLDRVGSEPPHGPLDLLLPVPPRVPGQRVVRPRLAGAGHRRPHPLRTARLGDRCDRAVCPWRVGGGCDHGCVHGVHAAHCGPIRPVKQGDSAQVNHVPDKDEVDGSNPFGPIRRFGRNAQKNANAACFLGVFVFPLEPYPKPPDGIVAGRDHRFVPSPAAPRLSPGVGEKPFLPRR